MKKIDNLESISKRQKLDESEFDKYKRKYKQLKQIVKDQVYLNAALHDELTEIEQKFIQTKTERKFLLKKLFEYLPQTEAQCLQNAQALHSIESPSPQKRPPPSTISTPIKTKEEREESISVISPTKKIVQINQTVDNTEEENDFEKSLERTPKIQTVKKVSSESSEKAKRKRPRSTKKRVQPLHLDGQGAPLFPVTLGTLTVYDLGEVLPERSGFSSERYIWPVGYCSTRLYPSMLDPDRRIQYFCYIKDGGSEPLFEIIAEDEPDESFTAVTATACHCNVLKRLNKARGKEATNTGSGPEFFGFSHPTIQYLIQCLPGAEKCEKYVQQEYEFPQRNATTTNSNVIRVDNKPNMLAFDRTKLELPKAISKTIDMG